MMKMKKAVLMSLYLLCSGVQSSELDTLIETSSAIVDQIRKALCLLEGVQFHASQTGMGISKRTAFRKLLHF